MLCSICGKDSQSEYCPYCGARMEAQTEKICQVCGTKGKFKFCKNCGTPFEDDGYKTCKVCGTKGKFNFCKNCGAPLNAVIPPVRENKPFHFNKKAVMAAAGVSGIAVIGIAAVIILLSLKHGTNRPVSITAKLAPQAGLTPRFIQSDASQNTNSLAAVSTGSKPQNSEIPQNSGSAGSQKSGGALSQLSSVKPAPSKESKPSTSTLSSSSSSSAPADSFVPDYAPGQKNYNGNTIYNIQNGGLAATQGNWIYYVNGNYGDHRNIYKIKTDGTGKTLVCNNMNQMNESINVSGDWVYFNSWGIGICRVRTDGSDLTILCREDSCRLIVIGDTIYYTFNQLNTDSTGLWKMKTDGSSRQQLTHCGAQIIGVDDGWIYYSRYYSPSDSKIYRIKTDGSQNQQVGDVSDYTVMMADGWYYYAGNSNLSKIQPDDLGDETKASVLDTGLLRTRYSLNTAQGWLYYGYMADNSGGGSLCRIKADGTQKQTVAARGTSNVNIVGDWIYYVNAAAQQTVWRMRLDGSGNEKVN